ncbi:MAG: M48 family metallopeptidase [Humidesulfovibrio sp.]|nr:M48 family metallopeptidase [Humidesulfovibrio sp.]
MTVRLCQPFCALLVLLLCSCAPQANLPHLDMDSVGAEAKFQQTLVLRDSVDKLDRLNRVGWDIRSRNAELCGERVVHGVGLRFLELDDYKKEQRELVQEVLGVSWRPTVFQIPPGSPGALAGMRRGDIVLLVSNVQVANKKEAHAAIDAAIEKGEEIPIVVERGGERLTFVIKAVPLCGYPVLLNKDPVVNAYADGDRIFVNLGLLKFIQSDDELAGVIGHELAHNTQKHVRDKVTNATLGRLLVDLPVIVLTGVDPNVGWQIGRSLYSQGYEFEADYVGQYYTARAGYDIRIVPNLWRRMALDDPKGITLGTTHPCTSERFVALDAAAAEIENKRKNGLALKPEIKSSPSWLAKKDDKKDEKKEAPKDLAPNGPSSAPASGPAPFSGRISADVEE